ncbi:hypothetical protein SAMN05518801_10516 [Novosphingobium sp. CF614]|uniref:hypothetical protein n=1 Tax=Novosphingobium sp. CF614 TaxID=1884364 RepID=UPI0008F33BE6|nr:hypothetical protein [Novosphingobium sp. CF614]SFF98728.1 hypothetical protein SAMN05518801_10516 [Novosphingobium sp. CF614]
MTRFHTALTATAALAALMLSTTAEARGAAHVRGRSGGGSVVAGQKGIAARAHGTVTSEDGTTTHASGGVFAGAQGSRGFRASQTSVSPDGTLSHQGAAAASGARGSFASEGGMTRSADGTWSGARTTSATNALTGNSYSGSTTAANGQVSHSGTCTNAAGETIPCRN